MSVNTPIFTTLSDMPSARTAADPMPIIAASVTASAVRPTVSIAYPLTAYSLDMHN
jgi:hypothetical protein